MSAMIRRTEMEVIYDRKGKPTYQIEIWHGGLGKHRVVKGEDPEIVLRKAELEIRGWEEKWKDREEARHRLLEEERASQLQKSKRELAARQTRRARAVIEGLRATLAHTLDLDDAIDWEALKDDSEFDEPEPRAPAMPDPPEVQAPPPEPRQSDPGYRPRMGPLDHLVPSRGAERRKEAEARFAQDHRSWEEARARAEAEVAEKVAEYERSCEGRRAEYREAVEAWRARRDEFADRRRRNHEAVARQKRRYQEKKKEAIEEYCDLVLSNSEYPDLFPRQYEIEYRSEDRKLIVDYRLPPPDALPDVKRVSYLEGSDEFVQEFLDDAERNELYDEVICQTILRTIHELYEADVVEALDTVVLNAWVRAVHPATGRDVEACIATLAVGRSEFIGINLARVDARSCVGYLAGRPAIDLYRLEPVVPLESCGPSSEGPAEEPSSRPTPVPLRDDRD